MINQEGYEHFLRRKIRLENKLEEVGDTNVSKEIEFQIKFVEERLSQHIAMAHNHAAHEVNTLNQILTESEKPEVTG